MLSFQNILVPTDFSPDADVALEYAIDLAKPANAAIHLLHVYHFPTYSSAGLDIAYAYPVDLLEEVRKHAAARVEEIQKELRARGVTVESEIIEGSPALKIVECAEREKADLIVMGTRGLTGLKHVALGSVAERTLRLAPCPVLTVKAASAD